VDVIIRNNGDTLFVKVSGALTRVQPRYSGQNSTKSPIRNHTRLSWTLLSYRQWVHQESERSSCFFKNLDSIKSSFEIKGIHENLYNIFKAVKLDKLFPSPEVTGMDISRDNEGVIVFKGNLVGLHDRRAHIQHSSRFFEESPQDVAIDLSKVDEIDIAGSNFWPPSRDFESEGTFI